ncbi:hypothetical protein JCM16106_18790 [Hydrogenophilus islandicus]
MVRRWRQSKRARRGEIASRLSAEGVKRYLAAHPAFFLREAAWLAHLELPDGLPADLVSLAHRQAAFLRAERDRLAGELQTLRAVAAANDRVARKVVALLVALQRANTPEAVRATVLTWATRELALPCVRWCATLPAPLAEWLGERPLRAAALPLDEALTKWLGSTRLRSAALLAVAPSLWLFFAHHDASYFTEEKGTLFLEQIRDGVRAAWSRVEPLADAGAEEWLENSGG